MPGATEHLIQAKHNEKLLAKLGGGEFDDWEVTLMFYIALHYVDAYLAKVHKIDDPGDHAERDRLVAEKNHTRTLYGTYMRLKSRSVQARYYCSDFDPAELEKLRNADLRLIRDRMLAAVA